MIGHLETGGFFMIASQGQDRSDPQPRFRCQCRSGSAASRVSRINAMNGPICRFHRIAAACDKRHPISTTVPNNRNQNNVAKLRVVTHFPKQVFIVSLHLF